jgi:putative FmdB family regulatory protein
VGMEPASIETTCSCSDLRAGIKSSHQCGEVCMPNYEFVCKACNRNFSKILHIAEHDKEKTSCPYCGSDEVQQSWSIFSAVTSKKSA